MILLLCCVGLLREAVAQDVYKLWEDQSKPFYKENQLVEYEEEVWDTKCVFNITEPTLTIYHAQGENVGKAVLIIPGGGYSLVAMYHEGYDIAKILSESGVTAAVLKYRLPKPESSDHPEKVPLADARRALKSLRSNSDKYGFDDKQVGVMGFSAGSHLATVASLWKSNEPDENPNFSALIYGVTNLTKANIDWLEKDLYHRKMTRKELRQNRLLDLVTKDTPPAFLVHAYDDDVCHVEESTLYAQRLIENDVKVEMHLFPTGGHGFGVGRKDGGTGQWLDLFVNWVTALE
ncbi:MAG: alpha/beta hydrolase [FCB group bacterium]|nr:alpha/beta hydrolase [FCB group bacterium]